jgi:hypothetical protein
MPDALAVARALRGGPATLEALRGRLGDPPHDLLALALDEARERGWVAPADEGEGDGVCSSGAPAFVRLTDAGRRLAA